MTYYTVTDSVQSVMDTATTLGLTMAEYSAVSYTCDAAANAAYIPASFEAFQENVLNNITIVTDEDWDSLYVGRFLDYMVANMPPIEAAGARDKFIAILKVAQSANNGKAATSQAVAAVSAAKKTADDITEVATEAADTAMKPSTQYAGIGAAIGAGFGTVAAGVGAVPGALIGASIGWLAGKVKEGVQ